MNKSKAENPDDDKHTGMDEIIEEMYQNTLDEILNYSDDELERRMQALGKLGNKRNEPQNKQYEAITEEWLKRYRSKKRQE